MSTAFPGEGGEVRGEMEEEEGEGGRRNTHGRMSINNGTCSIDDRQSRHSSLVKCIQGHDNRCGLTCLHESVRTILTKGDLTFSFTYSGNIVKCSNA